MAIDLSTIRGQHEQNWKKNRIPVSGLFELTPRCNLDCKMCYVHLTREQMGGRKELSTAQWLRIVDEAVDAGMLRTLLTGGECMLHEGFWEIYTALKKKGVQITLNTNGLLLTDETIERFRALPPTVFHISVYGASDDGYERTTGHRVFTRILRSIDKLIDAGIKPAVSLTISRYNRDEFIPMLKLLRDRGLLVSYNVNLDDAEPGTGRSAKDYALNAEETVDALTELIHFNGKELAKNEPKAEIPPRLPDDPSKMGLTCYAGSSYFTIRWDGRLGPCIEILTDLYVQDVGLAAGWEAIKDRAIHYPVPVECLSCRLRPICEACPRQRQDPADPGHADPAVCRRTVMMYNAGVSFLPEDKKEELPPHTPDAF